nr:unnamed protein product [Callosobruchus analis]
MRLNVNILNQVRSFGCKYIPNEFRNRLEDDPTDGILNADYSRGSIRYKVCRDSEVSKNKFVFEKRPVITLNREKKLSCSVKSLQGGDEQYSAIPTSEEKGYRTFDISTTQKNVVLPLKASKLSSPFPDPVKDFLSEALSSHIQPMRS